MSGSAVGSERPRDFKFHLREKNSGLGSQSAYIPLDFFKREGESQSTDNSQQKLVRRGKNQINKNSTNESNQIPTRVPKLPSHSEIYIQKK
jgi:hypothetical protein